MAQQEKNYGEPGTHGLQKAWLYAVQFLGLNEHH